MGRRPHWSHARWSHAADCREVAAALHQKCEYTVDWPIKSQGHLVVGAVPSIRPCTYAAKAMGNHP